SEDRAIWTVENLRNKATDILVHITDLVKRSKSQQFHGLMGRSSLQSAVSHISHLLSGNKGEIFVGFMGRRSTSGGSSLLCLEFYEFC
uniref:Uncharacterized protein n=1 Tax=Sinocyclocheilus grahami TaxID=75366 RepID=A0A672T455_SINGR